MVAHKIHKQEPTFIVKPAAPEHAEAIQTLAGIAYGIDAELAKDWFAADQYRSRIAHFPEGQYVAIDNGQVVGMTSSMRFQYNPEKTFAEDWDHTTGYGWLTTHDPKGEWMYGVETFVHPDYQSQGVGSRLMDARFEMLRRLNLRGLVAGSLFVGYDEVAERMTPEQYVSEVVAGKRFDSNLSKQLRKGFKVRNLIPNYTEEPRTRDYAAAIVWVNPEYRPRVVAFTQGAQTQHGHSHVPQQSAKPHAAARSGGQGIAASQL